LTYLLESKGNFSEHLEILGIMQLLILMVNKLLKYREDGAAKVLRSKRKYKLIFQILLR
jgi:hypothetical protein